MMSKSDEIRPLYRSVTKETVEMAITPIERWEMEVRNPDIFAPGDSLGPLPVVFRIVKH